MLLADLTYMDPDTPQRISGTWVGIAAVILGIICVIIFVANAWLIKKSNPDFQGRVFRSVESLVVVGLLAVFAFGVAIVDPIVARDMSDRSARQHPAVLEAKTAQVQAALEEKYGVVITSKVFLLNEEPESWAPNGVPVILEPFDAEAFAFGCYIRVVAKQYEIACRADHEADLVPLTPRT